MGLSTVLDWSGVGTRAPFWRSRLQDLSEELLQPPRSRDQVRLRTLVLVRWLAVMGQTAAVLFVTFGLGFSLPLLGAFVVIALSVLFNLVVQIRYPFAKRVGVGTAAAHSAFDVCQLAALLAMTGGLENPFTLLLLAPITVSATLLNLRSTLFLAVLGLVLITLLAFFFLPLPWYEGQTFRMEPIYVAGIWCALALGILFNSAYAWQVSVEADRMRTALQATHQVLSREQRLADLGGLAAAAAHELGTPLATIAVTVKEMSRDMEPENPHYEDVILLRDQAQRCREILSRLSESSSADGHEVVRSVALDVMLEEVASRHRGFGVDVSVTLEDEEASGGVPKLRRQPEIDYGLGNLVENAVDFASERVVLRAAWTDRHITLHIEDDGPGVKPEIIERLGEPYVTTRRPSIGDVDHDADDVITREEAAEQHGMGLGFFIAKTLLARTGASVEIANRPKGPLSRPAGAVVQVIWPRAEA